MVIPFQSARVSKPSSKFLNLAGRCATRGFVMQAVDEVAATDRATCWMAWLGGPGWPKGYHWLPLHHPSRRRLVPCKCVLLCQGLDSLRVHLLHNSRGWDGPRCAHQGKGTKGAGRTSGLPCQPAPGKWLVFVNVLRVPHDQRTGGM